MEPQKEYSSLVAKIQEYDKAYYVDSSPLVPDSLYDVKFKRLLELEKENPSIIVPDSPSKKVGGMVLGAFKTTKHKTPMLSIKTETEPSLENIQGFVDRIKESDPDTSLVAEFKYDGVGLSLQYNSGILTKAVMRGDGEKGENVVGVASLIRNIPLTIPDQAALLEIRGEVMVTKDDFERANIALIDMGRKPYINPRNAASGALRTLDTSIGSARMLRFYAYSVPQAGTVEGDGLSGIRTQETVLDNLKSMGFSLWPCIVISNDAKEILKVFDRYEDHRQLLPFEVDGVVIKANNLKAQKDLGYLSREPKWAIALKFVAQEQITKLTGIDIQIGRTGKVTPVARVTPIFVGGTTVSNITLHNVFDLRARGIRVGDSVVVRRAGDVIPEITMAVREDRVGYLPNFSMPKCCPHCGSSLTRAKGEREYRCTGELICKAQLVERIKHYSSKMAVNIDGLGDKLIEQLCSLGILNGLEDIYRLDKSNLSGLEGIGEKTIDNLLSAIESSKDVTFQRFLFGLGIRNAGATTSRTLASNYKTLQELERVSVEQLKELPDIGDVVANNVWNFIHTSSSYAQAKSIYSNYLRIVGEVETVNKLQGASFAITGNFDGADRQAIVELIRNNGGVFSSGVGKSTDYLIAGNGGGAKLSQAKSLKVPVITFNDFKGMFS